MDITVLNGSFEAIAVVDTIESIIWTERYNSAGDFELFVTASPEFLNLFQNDLYLRLPDTEKLMVIESREIKSNVETGDKLIIKGRSLASLLDRRVVFQRTIFNNIATQDAIWGLLLENAISPPGQPQRAIPGFNFSYSSDPAVLAPLVTAEYYGENLYDIIKFLCERSNLGFKLLHTDAHDFDFSLYSGKDRSYAQSTNPFVVFSPDFDNLVSSDFLFTTRFYKTIALIFADAYNGLPRPTADFDPWENDPTDPHYPTIRTGLARRELFVDAPDLSKIDPATGLPFSSPVYVKMLYERSRQALNENTAFNMFTGETDNTSQFQYGRDFFLGDIVQLEDSYGNGGRARITEFIISENPSGTKNYPTFTII